MIFDAFEIRTPLDKSVTVGRCGEHNMSNRAQKPWDTIVAATLWCIWLDKNNHCFHDGGNDHQFVIHHILTLVS